MYFLNLRARSQTLSRQSRAIFKLTEWVQGSTFLAKTRSDLGSELSALRVGKEAVKQLLLLGRSSWWSYWKISWRFLGVLSKIFDGQKSCFLPYHSSAGWTSLNPRSEQERIPTNLDILFEKIAGQLVERVKSWASELDGGERARLLFLPIHLPPKDANTFSTSKGCKQTICCLFLQLNIVQTKV